MTNVEWRCGKQLLPDSPEGVDYFCVLRVIGSVMYPHLE